MQLKSFHQGVGAPGRIDFHSILSFEGCFEGLIEDSKSIPTWCQVQHYLANSVHSDPQATVFEVEIPSNKVDEAFRSLTNAFLGCFAFILRDYHEFANGDGRAPTRVSLEYAQAIIEALKPSLDRGANLEFREEHSTSPLEQTSLGALFEMAAPLSPPLLRVFLPYICCRLSVDEDKIEFDKCRPAHLSCLAARSMPPLGSSPQVPKCLRGWIRMHQDLRSLLSEKYLRVRLFKDFLLSLGYWERDTSDYEECPTSFAELF